MFFNIRNHIENIHQHTHNLELVGHFTRKVQGRLLRAEIISRNVLCEKCSTLAAQW